MTTIELVWMVTLGTAVTCAGLDMFVAWLDGAVAGADWRRAVGIIVSQWAALLLMAPILSVALTGKG